MRSGSIRRLLLTAVAASLLLATAPVTRAQAPQAEPPESPEARDARMAWWREARFGMFIHWGLYAVPGGVWKGEKVGSAGEWIMHIGRIPAREYEPLVDQFNPVKFDADAWAQTAKDAGMKYLVITTKHHDGFALFDTATDDDPNGDGYDIMATQFKRDIMAELSDACRRHGIRIGWYHSILDWNHDDYLPKRDWSEKSSEDADFEAYKKHLFTQVREILTNYGHIDIMWFDGEWDSTWTHADGLKMAAMVRELQPHIIVNNRVDKGRSGMQGLDEEGEWGGDFGTPEQEIPATGLPGEDWETCMTMNTSWGFKTHDHDWKSNEHLIRNLIDIASKGGNFLLNVGPTAEGLIPEPSVERLKAMGDWLEINGESIYGTSAGPFEHLPWGRCTMKSLAGNDTRLYLHIFDWPEDGVLDISGIANEAIGANVLIPGGREEVSVWRSGDALRLVVPERMRQSNATVVTLDVKGAPDIFAPPRIEADSDQFVEAIDVNIISDRRDLQARYQLDPGPREAWINARNPLKISQTTTVTVRHDRKGVPVSGTLSRTFTKVAPRPAIQIEDIRPGVRYDYFVADCNVVADLLAHEPVNSGVWPTFDLGLRQREEHYGFRFRGLIRVPRDGMYRFYFSSDDGATFAIGDEMVVDHDGIHAAFEKHGDIALAAGLHPFEILFFEKGGDESLDLWIEGPDIERRAVGPRMLFVAPDR